MQPQKEKVRLAQNEQEGWNSVALPSLCKAMKTTEASSARWEKGLLREGRGMAKMTARRSDPDHRSTYSSADFCSLLAWQPAAVPT